MPVRWRNRLVLVAISLVLLMGSSCGRLVLPPAADLPDVCDVIIIGKGVAALTAAVEASRLGAFVMVLSEDDYLEQWLLDEGAVATLETADSAEFTGPPLSYKQNLRLALLSAARGSGQDWFFNLLAANSQADLTWFTRETGVELIEQPPVRYDLFSPSAEKVQQSLVNTAAEAGVQFLDQVTLTGIEENDHPLFFTLCLELDNGLQKNIICKAVLLSDGGYLNCPSVLQACAPGVEPAPWRLQGSGKGFQLADELHLDLVQLNQFYYSLGVQVGGRWEKAVFPDQVLLVVDQKIIPVEGENREWVIDALLKEEQAEGYLVVAESQLTDPEREQFFWSRHPGIDALMEHYGIDCPDLKNWHKRPDGNYRAARIKALAGYCLGGVAITGNGQVLRQGKPVSGLYAAGEITGGLHGQSLLSGAALTEALVLGRRAGAEAAAWSQK